MSDLRIVTPLSLSQLLDTDAESELNAFIEQNIAQNKCLNAQEINNFSIYWQTDMDDSKKLVTKSHLIQKEAEQIYYHGNRFVFGIQKSNNNVSLPARSLNIRLFYNYINSTPQYTIPANFKCNVYLNFPLSEDPDVGEIVYDKQVYAFGLQFKCVKQYKYYFKITDYFESCWENDKNNYEGCDKPKTLESVKNYFNCFLGYYSPDYNYANEMDMEEIIKKSNIYDNNFVSIGDHDYTIHDIISSEENISWWTYKMSYGNYDRTKILLDPSEIFKKAKIGSYIYSSNDSPEDITTFNDGVYLPYNDLENTEYVQYFVEVYIPEPFSIYNIDTLNLVITPTIKDSATKSSVFTPLKQDSNNVIVLGPIDDDADIRRFYNYYIDEGGVNSGSITAIRIANIPLARFSDDSNIGGICTIKTGVELGDGIEGDVNRNWGLRTAENPTGANYITEYY